MLEIVKKIKETLTSLKNKGVLDFYMSDEKEIDFTIVTSDAEKNNRKYYWITSLGKWNNFLSILHK